MARDAAMLEAADAEGLCILRLYSWEPATLSFGRNEPATRRYDRAAIEARGLATVRRPTGGRAVWHDREVTYAVAAPVRAFGSLPYTYVELHKMIAHALRTLGAQPRLATARPQATPIGAGACFASPAGGEVLSADGRKLVGSAQVRAGDAFLQHGSILLEPGQSLIAALTRGPAEPPVDAGLWEIIGNWISWSIVADAVADAATRRLGAERAPLPESVRLRAEALRPRFLDENWTWRR
jgi:lipoate-protein ligase A